MPLPVSIVIPTWNGRPLLEQFLPSVIRAADVYRQAGAPCEIVVVDDGGTDDTEGWVAAQSSSAPVPLRLIRLPANRGFGAAANTGVREAAHQLVFLVNNDVEVAPDAIAPLAARFTAEGRLFAVHCRVMDFATGAEVGTGKMGGFSRGFFRVHRSYITRGPDAGPLYSMFASGGSAMFDRAVFLSLGGFDDLFAPYYFEDVELSYRAWKRGFIVAYEPRSVVRHRFSSTIAPLAGRRVGRVAHRNRFLFHWIHLHDARLLLSHGAWLPILVLSAAAKPEIAIGLAGALRRLGAARVRRVKEKLASTRSDSDILAIFATLGRRPDIRPYDDPAQLVDKVQERSSRRVL
jgi:GT2 family glycosyltransferase